MALKVTVRPITESQGSRPGKVDQSTAIDNSECRRSRRRLVDWHVGAEGRDVGVRRLESRFDGKVNLYFQQPFFRLTRKI